MGKKQIVMVLGVVLLLVGILGFFNNPVIGLFDVDAIHNAVHIVTGLAAILLAAGMGDKGAAMFGKIFGIVYLLVAVLGFMTSGKILGFLVSNTADDFLHAALAIVFLWLGFMGGMKSSSMPSAPSTPSMPSAS